MGDVIRSRLRCINFKLTEEVKGKETLLWEPYLRYLFVNEMEEDDFRFKNCAKFAVVFRYICTAFDGIISIQIIQKSSTDSLKIESRSHN